MGGPSLRAALRWWRENRPIYWIHGRWEWCWLGNGWNRLALGKVSVYFASGPSPLARLRLELIRPARIRVANRISGHVNHYEAEFPLGAPPAVLTHEWLDETEIKLREGRGLHATPPAVAEGDGSDDPCPRCGIRREYAGYLRATCGDDYMRSGCFVIANVADRILREHGGTLRKLAEDD